MNAAEWESPEKLCPSCGEWWPLSTEFFRRYQHGEFSERCRACMADGNRVPEPQPIRRMSRKELASIVADARDPQLRRSVRLLMRVTR